MPSGPVCRSRVVHTRKWNFHQLCRDDSLSKTLFEQDQSVGVSVEGPVLTEIWLKQ